MIKFLLSISHSNSYWYTHLNVSTGATLKSQVCTQRFDVAHSDHRSLYRHKFTYNAECIITQNITTIFWIFIYGDCSTKYGSCVQSRVTFLEDFLKDFLFLTIVVSLEILQSYWLTCIDKSHVNHGKAVIVLFHFSGFRGGLFLVSDYL